jgi:hypothetical protein
MVNNPRKLQRPVNNPNGIILNSIFQLFVRYNKTVTAL